MYSSGQHSLYRAWSQAWYHLRGYGDDDMYIDRVTYIHP